MQHKKIIFTVALIALFNPLTAQTISRWHRLPRQGQPQIIRHPLEHSDQSGNLLRFRFEARPVTQLMRVIKRGFSELYPVALPEDKNIDISQATVFLEELNNEAKDALNHGYNDLDLSKESDFSIFDPDVPTETGATDSLLLPEQPTPAQATVSLTLSGGD
ncbi:MAG: hypothetical protein KKB51_04170 [Candidatus Riflebacteria bacterium]|nr:hypothetical protein [Candidatus Riflebacteria bacterium]